MPYKFAQERADYSALASGRVFYSQPGYPAFPIRLASEIFQRCLALRQADHLTTPCILYDPCCGAAYHLSVLAYLHWQSIQEVIGSDINETAVEFAKQNLGLLSRDGINKRINEIAELHQRYGKESHQAALDSARTLRDRIATLERKHPLVTKTFQADATNVKALCENLKGTPVDIVLADVPYDQHSHWQTSGPETSEPLALMLTALLNILSPASLVAIISDKGQKVLQTGYQRLDHFQVGKRRIMILKPNQTCQVSPRVA